MIESLTQLDTWIALLSLIALEIVLGIDNIVFIVIMAGRLPEAQRVKAYRLGLFGALFTRLALLSALSWIMGLEEPLFGVAGHEVTGRDLILIIGGLFLLAKSTHEIYDKLEGREEQSKAGGKAGALAIVVVQIMFLDIVFSLDSVITAVGIAEHLWVMMVAVVIAVFVMLLFAGAVGRFVEAHPSLKILALSFLILIGSLLVAEGLGQHVNKITIYFAMGFSLLVEVLNMRFRKVQSPVGLHDKGPDYGDLTPDPGD